VIPELELELDELLARPELDELELEELRPELEELEELEELDELDELEDEELDELDDELPAGVPVQAASARVTMPMPISERGSADPEWIFILQAL
jgi:hypothetical protein